MFEYYTKIYPTLANVDERHIDTVSGQLMRNYCPWIKHKQDLKAAKDKALGRKFFTFHRIIAKEDQTLNGGVVLEMLRKDADGDKKNSK